MNTSNIILNPTFCLLWLIALGSSISSAQTADATSADQPAELAQLVKSFTEEQTALIQKPIETKTDALHKKYLEALKEARETAIKAGDLDAVTEIDNEGKRVKAKEPLDPNTPIKSTIAKGLFDSLVKEEAKIGAQKQALEAQLQARFSEKLLALQKSLVQKTRIDDAKAVKDFREGGGMTAMVTGGSSSAPAAPVKPTAEPEIPNAVSPPAADQSIIYPPRPLSEPQPLPEVLCHVVIVKQETKEGGKNHTPKYLQECHKDGDRGDFVSLADVDFEWWKLGAIAAGGEAVFWQNQGELTHPDPVAAVDSIPGGPFVTLGKEGKVKLHGKWNNATEEEIAEFEGRSHIVSIFATKEFLGALDRDGRCYGIGSHAKKAHFQNLLKERSKICQFRTSRYSTIALLENGNVIHYEKAKQAEKTATKQSRLMRYGSLDRDGFFQPHPQDEEQWKKAGDLFPSLKSPRCVEIFATGAFALTADCQAIFWNRDPKKEQWERNPELEKAFAGAQEIRSLWVDDTRWLIALLPKGTVPRGGIWTAAELAAARTPQP